MKWHPADLSTFLIFLGSIGAMAMVVLVAGIIAKDCQQKRTLENEQRLRLYEACSGSEIRLLELTGDAPGRK